MDNYSKSGLYMEIDSFLDTRMAMIYCINSELAKSISSNEYNNRDNDNFGYMSYDIFTQLYSLRNKNLLELATPTKIKYMAYEICLDKNNDMLNIRDGYNRVHVPVIYFNTYPYNLDESEVNVFKKLLEEIYDFCEIEMINMDINKCNPNWIDKHVNFVIMYHGLKWLEYHVSNGNLIKLPLPGVTLIVPDIIFSRNVNNLMKKKEDILEGTKRMYQSVINLEFVYIGNYNTIVKD